MRGRGPVGSNPILLLGLACGLRPHPITLLTCSVPLLVAPLGSPEHREMGEKLPEAAGECPPRAGAAGASGLCELGWGLRAGRGKGRREEEGLQSLGRF